MVQQTGDLTLVEPGIGEMVEHRRSVTEAPTTDSLPTGGWEAVPLPPGTVIAATVPASRALVDPGLSPQEGDIVLLRKSTTYLRRIGPTHGGRTFVVAVDGSARSELEDPTDVARGIVVVGYLVRG